MRFLLYTQLNPHGIGQQMGAADYSYAFVLRGFAPVLARLGTVQEVFDPADIDAIYRSCLSRGEVCVLISFAPPHKTPLGLACPTVPLFAWEYPDIPARIEEQCWRDDPRHDWRLVFASAGRALCLSQHSVEAVQRSMGRTYPIAAIPAPVAPAMKQHTLPTLDGHWLRLHAGVIDSDQLGLAIDGVMHPESSDETPYADSDDSRLPRWPRTYPVQAVARPCAITAPADDPYQSPPAGDWNLPPVMPARLLLHGVVFTSVLNPTAGRKNWEDILSAFCWAFRDEENATLILKLTGRELLHSHHSLLMQLTKLSPFRCRVIALYGYLDDTDYQALIDASSFYVNASSCEGQCLPLVEFLNQGVPAIATDNTSMADYIDPSLAFVVASEAGLATCWPHGDGQFNRTSFHQLNWQSLVDAYRAAYQVATQDVPRYQRMGAAAQQAIQAYGGEQEVEQRLRYFFRADLAADRAHASARMAAAS